MGKPSEKYESDPLARAIAGAWRGWRAWGKARRDKETRDHALFLSRRSLPGDGLFGLEGVGGSWQARRAWTVWPRAGRLNSTDPGWVDEVNGETWKNV